MTSPPDSPAGVNKRTRPIPDILQSSYLSKDGTEKGHKQDYNISAS